MKDSMTFEEIDAHVAKSNILQYDKKEAVAEVAGLVPTRPAEVLKRICEVYKVVKPVPEAVCRFPLIPGRIKRAIKIFMSILDTLC